MGVTGHEHASGRESAGGEAMAGAEIETPLRRDPMAWLLALAGLFVLAYALVWASGLGDRSLTGRYTAAATVPCGILFVLTAIRIHRLIRLDPRARRAWTILTVALVVYGVGALIRFGATSVAGLNFLTYVATALEIGTYVMVAATLAMLSKPARTLYDLVLFILDVAMVAWSAAILTWHLVLFPTARDAGSDVWATIGVAIFPVADLSLIFAIGAVVLRGLPASSRAALTVAAVALLFVFAGDMASGIEILRRAYTQGGLSGLLYSAAWVLLAVAAYAQLRVRDRDRPVRGLADYARSFPWLPYVAVAVAFFAPAIRDWNDLDMLRQHVPATGLLIGMVVARLGVTARQNATLAAAERERLAAAVDQAAEAIITTDRDGNVSYVNPAFTRITGYPAAETIGRKPAFLRRGADPARMAELAETVRRGDSWEGRIVTQRRDGSEVEVDMAIAPLWDAIGARSGTVAVARDISHERALEAQLAQAQRMEAVGRLAGGIAHDFNNILTAISGFGELASTEVPADHPVAADLAQIRKASDRAASLTRALLAFSRRQVMQPSKVDLNDVVHGLTPMLDLLVGEGIELVVQADPELGPTLIDRAQFEQVIMNLAENARDSMPEGGRLTIATANADIDVGYARSHVGTVPGPYVKLTVSDTGAGMAPEVMEHAFEPFFTTKSRSKGTGLGLSTVIGVVSQSGGTVEVASSPGTGSVFTILLPRVAGTSEPDEATDRATSGGRGSETILVAEDEEAVRRFVALVLSRAGYRVHAAANGPEALAIARTLPFPDLLFTDMVMPGMGGRELARLVKEIHPRIRILYTSGYSDEALAKGFGSHGRAPFLAKPFTADALLLHVREVLDGPGGGDAPDDSTGTSHT